MWHQHKSARFPKGWLLEMVSSLRCYPSCKLLAWLGTNRANPPERGLAIAAYHPTTTSVLGLSLFPSGPLAYQ